MRRHFRGLAELNDRDMKWKKFFYRQLCQREGVLICKSPNCDICSDFSLCFEGQAEIPAVLVDDAILSGDRLSEEPR
jgi:nitrogen fixation protein NifQ